VDCIGLVIVVAHELELSTADATGYQRKALGWDFLRRFREHMVERPIKDAQSGDVMLFRDRQYPCHTGIVADRDGVSTLVHAYALQRRVVEEELQQGDWLSRRVACFTFPGLEET